MIDNLSRGRLLFVVNVDWFFLSHRLPIALEAMRNGYEVHIATGITSKLDVLIDNGLIVHQLKIDRGSTSILSVVAEFLSILSVLIKVRPNIVHLVTIKPALLGGLAARLAGVPAVVVAISGLGFIFVAQGVKAKFRRWIVTSLYRIAFEHSNIKVIFQNTDDRNCLVQLAGLAPDNALLVPGSGVDLTEYVVKPLDAGRPIVMFASRLLADKGVREFVRAAQLLDDSDTDFHEDEKVRFVLVGESDPSNPTSIAESELKRWEAQGVVELWGLQTEMPRVLASASIVVLPSYYGEGFPKILIEAAACGRAIVTTDHPGCRDAVLECISGLLVPVRDVDALAKSIKRLLDDPELCRKMGLAGREFAESSFGIDQVVAVHMETYASLIANLD